MPNGGNVILKGINDPLPQERLMQISPAPAPNVEADWLRRSHLFSGRSVNDRAFEIDQRARQGRLVSQAQPLTAGVFTGLEAWLELDPTDGWVVFVSVGSGVTATGEDVRLNRRLRAPLASIPAALANFEMAQPADDPPVRLTTIGELVTRRRGEGRDAVAFALLAVPAIWTRLDEESSAPFDPCEVDPSSAGFEDRQWVDGVFLAARELSFDLIPSAAAGARWPNALAYSVFENEEQSNDDARPLELWVPSTSTPTPVMRAGLGLGLIGFGPAIAPATEPPPPFLDAAALVRRSAPIHSRGDVAPFVRGTQALWQARIEQWTEQLRTLDDATLAALQADGLGTRYRFLPPVALLPPDAIDVRGELREPDLPLPDGTLLPDSYVVRAVPMELEALDDLVVASAPLAPLDLDRPEQVQVVVPVPQAMFDPDLLVVEDETPDDFNQVISVLLLRLNHRLGRRRDVRRDDAAFAFALVGITEREYPEERSTVIGELTEGFPRDSDLPASEPIPLPETSEIGSLETDQRTHARALLQIVGGAVDPAGAPRVAVLARFFESVASERGFPFIFTRSTEPAFIDDVLQFRWGGGGVSGMVDTLNRRLAEARELLDTVLEALASELSRVRSLIVQEDAAPQIATSPALTRVARRSVNRAAPQAVTAFRSFLTTPASATIQPVNYDIRRVTDGIPTGGRLQASAVLFGATIDERIGTSVAVDSAFGARQTRISSLRTLRYLHEQLALGMDSLAFPGFRIGGDEVDRSFNIQQMIAALDLQATDGTWPHDPLPTTGGEAAFFTAAARTLENAVAGVRVAEARLLAMEAVRDETQAFIDTLQPRWDRVQQRLEELQDELGELRQDITVARVLEEEEIARAR
ncbi:MAG: hypothetical protein AAFV29_00055, partial [Myxococcota bacterium]